MHSYVETARILVSFRSARLPILMESRPNKTFRVSSAFVCFIFIYFLLLSPRCWLIKNTKTADRHCHNKKLIDKVVRELPLGRLN